MKKLIIILLALFIVKTDARNPLTKLKSENIKTVNLYEHGYPVMLSCTLPIDAKIIQDYECYKIELNETTAIESISWYNKNGYDYVLDEYKARSSSSMLKESKEKILAHKKFKIIEEFDNGIHYVESYGYKDRPYLVFYFESVEQVYEVKCDPLFSYQEGELDLIMDVISSIKPIPYCYDKPEVNGSNEYEHDFSNEGFAFKMVLPSKTTVKTKRDFLTYKTINSIYDIEISDGSKYISIHQYSLFNKIDESFVGEKTDVKIHPRFIQMIYDDPTGYLAEFETTEQESDRYVFSYYYFTDSYFYVFKSTHENYSTFYEEKLHPLTLDLAKEMYLRVRDVKIGKVCK